MSAAIGYLSSAIAFASSMWAGVYLCMHDFPRLGGWVCVLTLFATWGFERVKITGKK